MVSCFLALPLPLSLRIRLASFCYGLPHVQWVEKENFYLILRDCGKMNDLVINQIQNCLETLFFFPFSLTLKEIGHFHTRGKGGVIWVGALENLFLTSLRKEIDRHLRKLHLPIPERSFYPHITLGYYERLNPQKLADYLLSYQAYQSEPIEITSCLFIRFSQTSKRMICEVLEEYPASPIVEIED